MPRALPATLLALWAASADAQARDSAAPQPLPSVSLPAELDRVLRDYERAWEGRDPPGLAALFTEDGFVLPSSRLPVRGRQAIAEAYREASGTLRLRALGFAVADTVGYIVGAYTFQPGGADIGKFLLALRRHRDGPWLIAADIDNSSRPRP